MKNLESVVRQIFESNGFSKDDLQLETTDSGRVGGFIVSNNFDGKSQLDRQDEIWKILDSLDETQRQKIVAILTVTPEEILD